MAKLFFEKYCGKIKKYKGKIGDKIWKFEKYVGENWNRRLARAT